MSSESVCENCGRKGQRGFVILRGLGKRYGGDEQLICANYEACAKRQEAAELRDQRARERASRPKRQSNEDLQRQLAAERSNNVTLRSANESLRRQLDPPDFSYFGLGDGPT